MMPKNDTNLAPKLGQTTEADSPKRDIDVYVKKWVDYSTKYGLGYILSNGNSGVFFNDCTKIIYNPQTEIFQYLERKGNEKVDYTTYWRIKSYPQELHKKVTLLLHFKSYLDSSKALQTSPVDKAEEVPYG